MIKLKKYNPTPLQYFISAGIDTPFVLGFIFFGNRRWGYNIDLMPMWLLIVLVTLSVLIVYILVHYLPPKFAIKAGILGWLTIPLFIVAVTY